MSSSQIYKISFFIIIAFISFISAKSFTISSDSIAQIDTTDYVKDNRNINLQIASYKGYTSEVERLIKLGADVNYKTWDGVTALMYASQNGFNEIVTSLLKAGSDPNLNPDNGINALHGAILNNHLETSEILIRNGANINQKDFDSISPLMNAVATDNYDIADMLLYYDADITLKDNEWNDALMVAVWRNNPDITTLLLEFGADINTQDNKGFTPAMVAIQNNNAELLKLLIESGADLELKNKSGETVLHEAIKSNNITALKLILEQNINRDEPVSGTLNPMNYARIHASNDSISKVLKDYGFHFEIAPQYIILKLSTSLLTNSYGTFWGFGAGISDNLYHISFDFNYGFSIRREQVMIRSNDYLYFQYWEKRNIISLKLSKRICLLGKHANYSLGLTPSIGGLYTFGNYEGTAKKASINFTAVPEIKLYVKSGSFILSAGYQYTDLGLPKVSNSFFSLSLEALINFGPKKNLKKEIYWL